MALRLRARSPFTLPLLEHHRPRAQRVEGDLAQALRRALGPADALTIERLAQLIEEVELRLFTHHLTPSSSSAAMGSWISTASATGFWTQLLQILLSLLSNDLQILLPKRDSRRSTL